MGGTGNHALYIFDIYNHGFHYLDPHKVRKPIN